MLRTGATLEDLDNDSYFDMIVGNYSGGLNYYFGVDSPPVSRINEKYYNLIDCELYPNPAIDRIFIDFKSTSEIRHVHINVYNLMSTIVLKEDFSSTLDLSLSVDHLPDGVYICEIILESQHKIRLYTRMIISR